MTNEEIAEKCRANAEREARIIEDLLRRMRRGEAVRWVKVEDLKPADRARIPHGPGGRVLCVGKEPFADPFDEMNAYDAVKRMYREGLLATFDARSPKPCYELTCKGEDLADELLRKEPNR